jgi:hypothetical protein
MKAEENDMRINPILYGILVLIVFSGTIFGFQAAGIWSTTGKLTSSGESVQPIASDVDSIKGWMTLEQVSTAFNLPVTEILSQFGLPADTPPSTALKDLETDLFSVTILRTWLKQKNLPSVPEITLTPSQKAGEPTVEVPEIITTYEAPTTLAPIEKAATLAATEHVAPAKTITGKTTFQELLYWGVPEEVIQKIIGSELPALSTVIKDYITGKGLEFSPIKAALQAEVDKLK